MANNCTGIILAGGLSSRFDGVNKALIRIGSQRIIDMIYHQFKELFSEVIMVSNTPRSCVEWDLNVVSDLYPMRSSLTGIHTGLFYTSNPCAFITACDTPFLNQELVKSIVNAWQPEYDVVVPKTSAGYEPLCAVYSKRCQTFVDHLLKRGQFKIYNLFRKVRTKTISEVALRQIDPELLSFFNINTPQQLEQAKNLALQYNPLGV